MASFSDVAPSVCLHSYCRSTSVLLNTLNTWTEVRKFIIDHTCQYNGRKKNTFVNWLAVIQHEKLHVHVNTSKGLNCCGITDKSRRVPLVFSRPPTPTRQRGTPFCSAFKRRAREICAAACVQICRMKIQEMFFNPFGIRRVAERESSLSSCPAEL